MFHWAKNPAPRSCSNNAVIEFTLRFATVLWPRWRDLLAWAFGNLSLHNLKGMCVFRLPFWTSFVSPLLSWPEKQNCLILKWWIFVLCDCKQNVFAHLRFLSKPVYFLIPAVAKDNLFSPDVLRQWGWGRYNEHWPKKVKLQNLMERQSTNLLAGQPWLLVAGSWKSPVMEILTFQAV